MSLGSPMIKVFKMDKAETQKDTLYGEENTSRIYLPPFEIRAFHFDNPFRQLLGYEALIEEEDNLQLVVNFEDMVQKIRDLRGGHISDMYISYNGDSSNTPSAYKNGDTFLLKVNGSIVQTYDLSSTAYNTTKKLGTAIDVENDFSVTLYGKNDESSNIVNFNDTTFKGSTLRIYSLDHTYDNITDIIEIGDVILTNKWRLYEVKNAVPTGDFMWDYVTYTLFCNLARIDQVSLPKDYEEQIAEHQYGLKNKLDME